MYYSSIQIQRDVKVRYESLLHRSIRSSADLSWLSEVGHHDGSQLGIQHHLKREQNQLRNISLMSHTDCKT